MQPVIVVQHLHNLQLIDAQQHLATVYDSSVITDIKLLDGVALYDTNYPYSANFGSADAVHSSIICLRSDQQVFSMDPHGDDWHK